MRVTVKTPPLKQIETTSSSADLKISSWLRMDKQTKFVYDVDGVQVTIYKSVKRLKSGAENLLAATVPAKSSA